MPLVTIQGQPLRYREAGRGRAGTPLVLVHGAGGSSAMWLGVMHRLARQRRTIALDLPGHGRSAGAPTTLDELVGTVGELCATLCLDRALLVGHSMGGLVAVAAALAWPTRVAGLALITTGARLRVAKGIEEALASAWPHWTKLLADAAYSPETPAELRRRGAQIACAASQEQTLADFRICAATDLRERLAELDTPTLVVTGAHDLLTPPKLGEELASKIRGARRLQLARTGHMPMHESPDALAAALAELATRADAA